MTFTLGDDSLSGKWNKGHKRFQEDILRFEVTVDDVVFVEDLMDEATRNRNGAYSEGVYDLLDKSLDEGKGDTTEGVLFDQIVKIDP